MAAQDRGEELFFPDPPFLRILRWFPRVLRGAPKPFPRLTAFIDPHGRVGVRPRALHALHEVVGRETGQLEQAARLGSPDRLLKSLCTASRFQIIFVDADDSSHSSSRDP